MAVVVNTVDGFLLRAWSHVVQKVRKTLAPFRTHGDAATTIVWILRIASCEASTFGVLPRFVFSGFDKSSGVSMRGAPSLNQFSSQTSTTIGSYAELFGNNISQSPAIASARPIDSTGYNWRALLNYQSPVSLTGSFNNSHRQMIPPLVCL
jgi:hypothetical protein